MGLASIRPTVLVRGNRMDARPIPTDWRGSEELPGGAVGTEFTSNRASPGLLGLLGQHNVTGAPQIDRLLLTAQLLQRVCPATKHLGLFRVGLAGIKQLARLLVARDGLFEQFFALIAPSLFRLLVGHVPDGMIDRATHLDVVRKF